MNPAARTAPTIPDDDLVQLLDPDGRPVTSRGYSADPSPDELRALYRDMAIVRGFDAQAAALAHQGELALWASLKGQEAAQVGSAHALRRGDMVFPSYREHGVALHRGVDPLAIMRLWRGVSHGGWDPAKHNFHLYTIVIGAQALHAAGYAIGVAKEGANAAVICYFGDGATSQGDVAEAFNFAAVCKAPILFFCQNNQWAISTSVGKQTGAPIYRRAGGFGFPGVRVDGNDALAVLAVTKDALAKVRAGEGPVLIEAHTYRMGAHASSDDPTRYRTAMEQAEWERKDPLRRMRAYLERCGHTDEGFFAAVQAEADAMAERVRDGVLAMNAPTETWMFDHVYAGGHPLVAEERAGLAAYLDSFERG